MTTQKSRKQPDRGKVMRDYRQNHQASVTNQKRKNAAKTIQRVWRNKNLKKSPIKQSVRDLKRQALKEKQRITTDASYRKKVVGELGTSVGRSTVTGAAQTIGKVAAGALAGYIFAKSKSDDKKSS